MKTKFLLIIIVCWMPFSCKYDKIDPLGADFKVLTTKPSIYFPVQFADVSIGATSWKWEFGNGKSFIGQKPPAQIYSKEGSFTITLTIRNQDGVEEKMTQTIIVGPLPEQWVLVPGGTFMMGDITGDNEYSDEKPLHPVFLDSFLLCKYEVTFDEYDPFFSGTSGLKPSDNGWGRGKRPVINVSWDNAVDYCNWLSERQGLKPVYSTSTNDFVADWTANGYRLPTEAEWEYAARGGGKKIRFGNGKDIADPEEMNFNSNNEYNRPYTVAGEYRDKTVEVGSFISNSLGLYDMSGNVWEWCWDAYDEDFYKNSPYILGVGYTRVNNPKNSKSFCGCRVLRGGAFNYGPERSRVSFRGNDNPGGRFWNAGFRIARSLSF